MSRSLPGKEREGGNYRQKEQCVSSQRAGNMSIILYLKKEPMLSRERIGRSRRERVKL